VTDSNGWKQRSTALLTRLFRAPGCRPDSVDGGRRWRFGDEFLGSTTSSGARSAYGLIGLRLPPSRKVARCAGASTAATPSTIAASRKPSPKTRCGHCEESLVLCGSARSRRKRSRERPWAARLPQARRWAARGYRIDQIRCSATSGNLVMGDALLADLRIMNWHASRSETSLSPIVPGIANPPQKSGLTGRSGRERLGKSERPRKAVQRPVAGLLRLTLRSSSMAWTDLSRDFKAEFDLASGVTGRFTPCEEPRAPS
jgi:hypothetical protein